MAVLDCEGAAGAEALRPPVRRDRGRSGLIAAIAVSLLVVAGCATTPPAGRPSSAPTDPTAGVTTTPTPSTTSTPELKPTAPSGEFELPVVGSVGFAAVPITLRKVSGTTGGRLAPGDWFTITAVKGSDWIVVGEHSSGRLKSSLTLINLPDLIPSIVYTNSNSKASVFRSSAVALPGITGKRLYQARGFNDKLQQREYFMPVRFPVAQRIQVAQSEALDHGQSLVIYEAFRPADVQHEVGATLTRLAHDNATVRSGLTGGGWGLSSFIALNLSNHQLGVAIDATLGKVTDTTIRNGRDYRYTEVTVTELPMQTPIHELSRASTSYAYPVRTKTGDAWRTAPLNPKMTSAAKKLRRYAIDAGLRPISSEWWHFEDIEARAGAPMQTLGRFRLKLPGS